MSNLPAKNVCPKCGQGNLSRRRRKSWMRLLPRSKYYRCNYCSANFLIAFNHRLRLSNGV